ncbi:MAG: beta strand repeat-containing protein [Fimbriimonas sp.]
MLLTCLTAVASSQTIDVQWASSTVNSTVVVRYSPNGENILTVGGNQLRLWRASNGSFLWARTVSNLVDAQFSANSSVVLAGTDTSVRKISVATGADTGAFSSDAGAKGYIGVSPDGTLVGTTTDGTTVNLYNTSDGTLASSFAATPGPSTPNIQFVTATGQPLKIMVGTTAYLMDGTLWGNIRGAAGDSALIMQQLFNGNGRPFVLEGNGGVYTTLYAMSAVTPGAVAKSYDVSAMNITPRSLSGAQDRTRKVFALGGNNGAMTAGFVGLLDAVNGGVLGNVVTPYAGASKSIACSPTADEFALVSQVGSTSTWKLELYRFNATKTGATRQWVQSNNSLSPITQVTTGPGNAAATNTPIFVTGSSAPIASNPGSQVFNGRTGDRFRTMTETMFFGTRSRQLTVSPDGKYLGVVFNSGGNNLRIYDLTTGSSFLYAGHVTGAAFLTNTDLVVDGPTRLRIANGTSVSAITFNWAERGQIIDPAVSPDGTKVAMIDIDNNNIVVFNALTGTATRYTNGDTLADFGFESDNDLWTLVRNNVGASNSARIRVYGVGATLTLKQDRTSTIPLLTGGGFTGWQATESNNGKWAAFVATRTDSTGAFVNTVRFWRWADSTQTEFEVQIPGSVGGIKFSPDSSMLQLGTSTGAVMSINVPVFPVSVTVNPSSINGGVSTTGTVTITEPGRVGGTIVYLSATGVLQVPEFVVVPEGATSVQFTIKSSGVDTGSTQSVTASLNGRTASANVTVNPPVMKSVVFATPTMEGGDPIDCTISITGKAGPSGVTIPLTLSSTLTGSSSAVIPAGESSVTNTYTTKVRNVPGTGRIDATLNSTTRFGKVTIYEPKVTDLQLSAGSVVGGTSLTGTVTISRSTTIVAGINVTVTSDSAAATVPAVNVARNTTTKSFTITTTAVSSDTLVTISAQTSDGTVQSQSFTITAPTITSVALDSSTVAALGSTQGTVTISSAAPVGGYLVDMSSSNAVATVDDVTIPEGQVSTTFTVNTTDTDQDESVTISGTHDSSSADAPLTVLGRGISSVTLDSNLFYGGTSTTGTVTINRAAPVGGYLVAVTTDVNGVSVSNVTIPEGETSTTFAVTSVPISSDSTGTVTGTHDDSTASAALTVKAPTVKGISQSATTVTGGTSVTITIKLNSPAPSGFTFNLASNSIYATCPSSVTFAAGGLTKSFIVNTTSPPSPTIVKISVTRSGFISKKTITINP